jgi:YidC/Oxa1 family membrane protein insertase
LYSVLGGTPGKPGLMMKYLAQNGEVGSFYQIIPNISLTPQQVWNTHNYVMFIPYILLVLLFAVSIWLPQALMPGDKQQKMIGGYMAIVMLYFGWVSPAGVLLYWDVSSIFGIIQQQITMSVTKKELAARDSAMALEKTSEKSKKKTATTAAAEVADKKPANKDSKKSKKS